MDQILLSQEVLNFEMCGMTLFCRVENEAARNENKNENSQKC